MILTWKLVDNKWITYYKGIKLINVGLNLVRIDYEHVHPFIYTLKEAVNTIDYIKE